MICIVPINNFKKAAVCQVIILVVESSFKSLVSLVVNILRLVRNWKHFDWNVIKKINGQLFKKDSFD